MPKTVSCNSFYMFMIDTRKRLEARGERFPRGLEDVVHVAAEIWETMTPEQKNVYKEKAKDYKKSDEFNAHKKEARGRLPKQMRGNGAGSSRRAAERAVEEEFVEPVPYIYPSDDEEANEEFRKKHVKDRIEISDAWKWNLADSPDSIFDLKCHIISFIAHCRTSGYDYYPGEIAIVEFSLRNGVTNSMSRILGPHALPANLIPVATENMNSHKIPFATSIEGMTNNYVRVMEEILRFCRPSKSSRRLICLSKEFNCVQGCIKFIECEAKMADIRADRINCVEDLFQLFCEWREKVCAPAEWRAFNDCDGLLPTAPFFQHPGLLCEFHLKEGCHHCALATAKRAAFYFLQRIQSHYKIRLTEKHSPPPMTPEAEAAAAAAMSSAQDVMAAAAAINWQAAGAFLRQKAEQMREDERSSVVSVSTVATRRTAATEMPDTDDAPRTLPMGLRGLAGHGGAPDCWQAMTGAEQASAVRELSQTPSIRTGATSVGTQDFMGEHAPPVEWNQNREVRDYVFGKDNKKFTDFGNRNKEQSVADGKSTDAQGMQCGATASQIRPRVPVSKERFQTGSGIVPGGDSSLASEFGNMHFQQPVVFPPPQNAVATSQAGFSGARPRGTMAPRSTVAPNPSSGNYGASSAYPLMVGEQFKSTPMHQMRPSLGANSATAGGFSQPQATNFQQEVPANVARGPPVKTQSRVKQMLKERLRQNEQSGSNA